MAAYRLAPLPESREVAPLRMSWVAMTSTMPCIAKRGGATAYSANTGRLDTVVTTSTRRRNR